MKTLSAYLDDAGLSGKAFAERIGVDPSVVSRIRSGAISPSLRLAFVIERETGGQVPASSWAEAS